MTKKLLIIADMCTVGQCSLSVALPVVSACGIEACPLPVELLSTHSVGFEEYSRNSMFNAAQSALKSLFATKMRFDGVMTMYLGGAREVGLAHSASELLASGGLRIADPAMADGGALYPDLDDSLAREVASLVAGADAVTPNLTEACLLARAPYRENYDEAFVLGLARTIRSELGGGKVVVTGVSLKEGSIGAFAYDGNRSEYFSHRKEDRMCHGAGDLFSSALAGLMMRGESFFEAARRAEEFVYASILATLNDKEHFYGLHFEKCLHMLAPLPDESD